jgi:hypothetical protein
MTSHLAFEMGVATTVTSSTYKALMALPSQTEIDDLRKHGFAKTFYQSLDRITSLDMYNRFLATGWTRRLGLETKKILVPEIIKCVALIWASAYWDSQELKMKDYQLKVQRRRGKK